MSDQLFDTSEIAWGQLAELEQRVRGSETTGIRARWEFGCYLRDNIPAGTGGPGRGPLHDIAGELDTSVRELRYRRQFATQYPTEKELGNALLSYGSWHEIIAHGLVRDVKEPVEPPPLPDGEWRTIVADPPWDVKAGPGDWATFTDISTRPLEYPALTIDEIAALEVKDRVADDAHLYLWTINRYVPDAYEIAKAWGFKPSTLLVWTKKPHGWGLGGTFGLTTEYVLFARRGQLEAKRHVDTSWFEWPRGRHSEKPGAFYDLVVDVSPGPYLELFGRQLRDGWQVWGDEVAA